jgi:DNA-binding response OmpR family regulator
MPVLDGFAVLSEVKADTFLREIPVIIVSAVTDSKSIVKGIKQGADDYLTKPVDPTLLVQKVKEYLG